MFWMIIATLCSSFVKGLCGFADTLIFSTILSFHTDNIHITPLELIVAYPSNLIISFKERKSINWRICLPLAAIVIAGNIPGILLLKNADAKIIKIFFGFIIIGMGIEMFFRQRKTVKSKQSTVVLGIIGLLSGILCGLYGIGALLAAYVDRVTEDTKAFKANLCVVFLIECTFRAMTYVILGILTWDIFTEGLMLVPLMLIGLLMGMKSSSFLDEKTGKVLVNILLVIAGIALIVNNIG
jgi:hypothetical protein